MQESTRRDFLKTAGKLTAGAMIGASALSLIGCDSGNAAPANTADPVAKLEPVAWPWPYAKLNVEAATDGGYNGYMDSDCSFGAFHGIVAELRKEVGYPYDFMPTEMFKFGGGGVAGWGTLCGALTGACAAINLVCDEEQAKDLINDLMAWYGQTSFPEYMPATPKKSDQEIVQSVSDSPLCHASVSNWCSASGHKANSPERSERCGRLTADVVKQTVTLLNAHFDGSFAAKFAPPASVTECMSCHGKDAFDDTRGKMDCLQCHDKHD